MSHKCLHYYHAECRGSEGGPAAPYVAPRARDNADDTPSLASLHHHHRHLDLSIPVSLEKILDCT
jgi:hypothetical protein